jgi:hypothetical protein
MGIFGPHAHYPLALQQAVDHAERFAALLATVEVRHRPADRAARAWLTGRSEELEMVIAAIVADWIAGRLTADGTTSAVLSYLRAVHAGAERYLRLGPMPACCLGDIAATHPYTPYEQAALTVRVPTLTKSDSDTLVDPASLVQGEDGNREG